MVTRHSPRILLLSLLLASSPLFGNSTDNKMSPDEAVRVVSELVASVGPAFGCEIVVVAFKESSSDLHEVGHYFVSFEASGARCDQAHKVLNYRGGYRGLVFLRTKKLAPGKDPRKEPNVDLIHKIDPPIEDRL